MLTKIDLCSMALLKLGEQPIQSLMDDSAAAQLGRTLFDPVIDALIAVHPWRFACRRFDLVRNSDGDFVLPTECLRVIKSVGNVIGNKIVAPTDTVSVIGVARIAPDKFPGYFVSVAATKLAMEFSVPLTGDQAMFRMLAALYETELQTAKFIDGTTSSPSKIENFSLINSRF